MSDTPKLTPEPRVFMTDDARHASCLYQMQPPLEPADLQYNIDQLANSGFDTLMYWAGVEGGAVIYDSKVAPLWGDNVKMWTHPVWYRAARNLRQLIADGHDPLKVMVDRAHEKGIWFFAGNWVNFQGSRREISGGLGRTCDWVYEHPQYEVGEEDDPRAADIDSKRFSFLHEEVRRMRFAVYEEYLSRYETDGIDLDMVSLAPLCRFDQVGELAPLMTQWLRDLRIAADKPEQTQAHLRAHCGASGCLARVRLRRAHMDQGKARGGADLPGGTTSSTSMTWVTASSPKAPSAHAASFTSTRCTRGSSRSGG